MGRNDPLIRMRKYLEAKGLWSEEEEKQVMEEAKNTVNEEMKKAEQTAKMTIRDLSTGCLRRLRRIGRTESIIRS